MKKNKIQVVFFIHLSSDNAFMEFFIRFTWFGTMNFMIEFHIPDQCTIVVNLYVSMGQSI